MVYFVIAAITVGAALVVCAVIVIIYLNVCKRFAEKGKEAHLFDSLKLIRDRSIIFVAVVAVAVTAGFMLYAQEKGFGITAAESFNQYLAQNNYEKDDYYEADCGNYVFYISRSDKQAEEEWLVYEKSGLFFSRVYGAGRSFLLPCNDDGTLWVSAVEFETSDGYFYYMSFYKNSVLNRVDVTDVLINGSASSLVGGKYIVTETAITSVSIA